MSTIVRPSISVPAASRLRPLQSLAKRTLVRTLSGFTSGHITLTDSAGTMEFGNPAESSLRAALRINDPRAYPAVAFGGSVGAGDAFCEGWWEADDPAALVQILLRNYAALERLDRGGMSLLREPVRRALYRLERNSRSGSRRNIAAHYDLSNDFFALFLDPTMTYSCAIFEEGATTLEEASRVKLDRACRKLDLKPTDHLLEIGTGWGSMAMHAAANYGCRVTSTTISKRQAELARRRIAQAGLADRIDVVETDYRDLTGSYDKLVSIEMIEAVGAEHFDAYFAKCCTLLTPEGMMLLQAITIRDQFFARAARTRDWLKHAIFPGSCLTSVESIMRSVTRSTDMTCLHLEDIGPHYVTTLRTWRDNFTARLDDVRALGFDERFIRMWTYYLCYCQGAFAERHSGDVQMLLARRACRREPYNP